MTRYTWRIRVIMACSCIPFKALIAQEAERKSRSSSSFVQVPSKTEENPQADLSHWLIEECPEVLQSIIAEYQGPPITTYPLAKAPIPWQNMTKDNILIAADEKTLASQDALSPSKIVRHDSPRARSGFKTLSVSVTTGPGIIATISSYGLTEDNYEFVHSIQRQTLNIITGKVIQHFTEEQVQAAPPNLNLATSSDGKTIVLRDNTSMKKLIHLTAHASKPITQTPLVTPDKSSISLLHPILANHDCTVVIAALKNTPSAPTRACIWSLKNPAKPVILPLEQTRSCTRLILSPDGTALVTIHYKQGELYALLWNISDPAQPHALGGTSFKDPGGLWTDQSVVVTYRDALKKTKAYLLLGIKKDETLELMRSDFIPLTHEQEVVQGEPDRAGALSLTTKTQAYKLIPTEQATSFILHEYGTTNPQRSHPIASRLMTINHNLKPQEACRLYFLPEMTKEHEQQKTTKHPQSRTSISTTTSPDISRVTPQTSLSSQSSDATTSNAEREVLDQSKPKGCCVIS